ncbi:MAG TPA: dihydroorotate dehydrogenase electron transfer subunit [Gemmatimonadota bacterium]|nr:dihydroorotate dehydrogenase electron transfer subunit [Gemmatimonadota bacterium]
MTTDFPPAAPMAGGDARVLSLLGVDDVGEGTCWLRFARPAGADCDPGQFFMISPVEPTGGVFLGRPFSIGDVRDEQWRFLVRALGRGTRWLRSLGSGAPLRVVGPLGRPFDLAARPVHRLVAGGVGLAPFFHLARRLRAERPGTRIELWYGERTAAAHTEMDSDEAGLFDVMERFTDDGSRGRPGTVVDGLAGRLADPDAAWYACGPHPMLRALAGAMAAAGTEWARFSLEERMACGFGVCQACVVPRADGPGYRLLCMDGPVVDPREVAW